MKENKVFISTFPFGERNDFPVEMLTNNEVKFICNPLKRKLTEDEMCSLAKESSVIIAGTEPITEKVFQNAPHLRHISRVGVGLDSVDLQAAQVRGISISYTPEAPAPAVAELTIGLIINLLRNIHLANDSMHAGKWNRFFGRRVAEITLGIIGVGRIGARVLRRTAAFGTPRILANDLLPNLDLNREFKLEWVSKKEIFRQADVITLHVPLTPRTRSLVGDVEISLMKSDALLINTSRGGVVDEQALFEALKSQKIAGAAVDVFEEEPYCGPLADLPNCLLTSHMGSMSLDCRSRMEIEATEEAIRFLKGQPLLSPVPQEEYDLQSEFKSE
ncbi:MAG: lactate dehydrogenase, partial [Cyclobacteriaceae bacterium]|nr:lactate dehydrogenase [Cyclobacteriaceae bacterium]